MAGIGSRRVRPASVMDSLRIYGGPAQAPWVIRSSVRPLSLRPLFSEPHRVQLLAQVVARRDGPALHLPAVRDDPMPLERVEIVDLVVQQPFFELADVLLALIGIPRPAPLQEQPVERL